MTTPMHDHCHEDMGEEPCGKPPVAYRFDTEHGSPYPVCRRHHRPPYWVGLPEVEAERDAALAKVARVEAEFGDYGPDTPRHRWLTEWRRNATR